MIWAESVLILGLLIWVSVEYESNLYLQDWFRQNIGPFGFLFNGTLAGLYAGTLVGYGITLYMARRSEEGRILESLIRKDEDTE